MLRSTGFRAIVAGGLTILMSIPALFVADVINARAEYNRAAVRSVGAEWGGPQTLSGPVLVIPVTQEVTTEHRRPVVDPLTGIQRTDDNGVALVQLVDETTIEARAPIYVLPNKFNGRIRTQTEERSRGIFRVPVYSGELNASFDFDVSGAEAMLRGTEEIHWDDSALQFSASSNRGLRGVTELLDGELTDLPMESLRSDQAGGGFVAQIGDPRESGAFTLRLGLFGADRLFLTPAGRSNVIQITSDWPDPAFSGAFLPNTRDVQDAGFDASWEIPHLARSVPQVSREDPKSALMGEAAFGVRFYQPNDFYQKSFRATRYALMFIGLTFLGIFLADRDRTPPTHPVQYLMVGLSQLVFFLLMVSLAEQVGFGLAYLISTIATVGLITAFTMLAMGMGSRGAWLGAGIGAIYAVAYLILQSTDYALLAGSILAFAALAGTMWVTRKETWHDDPNGKGMLSFLLDDPDPKPTGRSDGQSVRT